MMVHAGAERSGNRMVIRVRLLVGSLRWLYHDIAVVYVLGLLLFAVAAPVRAESIVVNGGFEDGATGWWGGAYYGPAGTYLKQYIDLMHEASAQTHAPIWEKTNVDSPMFTLSFVASALFDKAEVQPDGA